MYIFNKKIFLNIILNINPNKYLQIKKMKALHNLQINCQNIFLKKTCPNPTL